MILPPEGAQPILPGSAPFTMLPLVWIQAVVVSEEHPTYASESVAINAIIAEMEGRRIETSGLARSAARLAWPINWVVAS